MKLTKQQKELLAVTPDDKLKVVFPEFTRAFLREEKRKCKKPQTTEEQVEQDKDNLLFKSAESELSKKYKKSLSIINSLQRELGAALELSKHNETYRIIPSRGVHSEATAVIVASDWHYEELVKSANLNGLNQYNLEIADQRIEKFFQNALRLLNICKHDVEIHNIVFALLGDFISGNIHEENLETAQLRPAEAAFTVQRKLMSGIKFFLENTDCNLVIPCSVGNHCVSRDTEILTSNGFKLAGDVTENDLVASFDVNSGNIRYDKFEAKTEFSQVGRFEIMGKHKNEVVSSGHNLVVNGKFLRVDDFVTANRDEFRHCGYGNSSVDLTDDELRLITWVVCDGTLVDNRKYISNSTKRRVQFKLSKKRKIDELTALLKRISIPYTIKPATMSSGNVLQPYLIRIYGDWARKIFEMLDGKKQFPKSFMGLSKEQVMVVLDTIAITDGCRRAKSIEWSSINKHNIDVIQVACIANGIPFKYQRSIRPAGFVFRKPLYIADIYPNGFNGLRNQIIRSAFVNKKTHFVGIQTKLGTLITRRNGVVNFTGNSRITQKIHNATEVGNSLEGLMYHNMAMCFENEPRVQFVIGEGYHTYLTIYDKLVRFHHGHAIKYKGGVGGVYIPLNSAITQWNKAKFAYLDVLGHWHQQRDGGNFMINGSIIGYSAYSLFIKAEYEEPKQLFFLIDRDRGKTIVAPILVNKD